MPFKLQPLASFMQRFKLPSDLKLPTVDLATNNGQAELINALLQNLSSLKEADQTNYYGFINSFTHNFEYKEPISLKITSEERTTFIIALLEQLRSATRDISKIRDFLKAIAKYFELPDACKDPKPKLNITTDSGQKELISKLLKHLQLQKPHAAAKTEPFSKAFKSYFSCPEESKQEPEADIITTLLEHLKTQQISNEDTILAFLKEIDEIFQLPDDFKESQLKPQLDLSTLKKQDDVIVTLIIRIKTQRAKDAEKISEIEAYLKTYLEFWPVDALSTIFNRYGLVFTEQQIAHLSNAIEKSEKNSGGMGSEIAALKDSMNQIAALLTSNFKPELKSLETEERKEVAAQESTIDLLACYCAGGVDQANLIWRLLDLTKEVQFDPKFKSKLLQNIKKKIPVHNMPELQPAQISSSPEGQKLAGTNPEKEKLEKKQEVLGPESNFSSPETPGAVDSWSKLRNLFTQDWPWKKQQPLDFDLPIPDHNGFSSSGGISSPQTPSQNMSSLSPSSTTPSPSIEGLVYHTNNTWRTEDSITSPMTKALQDKETRHLLDPVSTASSLTTTPVTASTQAIIQKSDLLAEEKLTTSYPLQKLVDSIQVIKGQNKLNQTTIDIIFLGKDTAEVDLLRSICSQVETQDLSKIVAVIQHNSQMDQDPIRYYQLVNELLKRNLTSTQIAQVFVGSNPDKKASAPRYITFEKCQTMLAELEKLTDEDALAELPHIVGNEVMLPAHTPEIRSNQGPPSSPISSISSLSLISSPISSPNTPEPLDNPLRPETPPLGSCLVEDEDKNTQLYQEPPVYERVRHPEEAKADLPDKNYLNLTLGVIASLAIGGITTTALIYYYDKQQATRDFLTNNYESMLITLGFVVVLGALIKFSESCSSAKDSELPIEEREPDRLGPQG